MKSMQTGSEKTDSIRLKSEEVLFFERKDVLSHRQDDYYQDLFYRVLKIGTELECARPRGVDPVDFKNEIADLMKPSLDLENLGELGIYDVVKEHCGVELQVIGRHPQWSSLHEQYNKIISILLEKEVRMKATCGLHFHLIAIGLAETIPEIILANLWNLIRRHAPGLKFLFSGGNVPEGICRRRQHNAHQEFVSISPVEMKMGTIKDRLKESIIVPEHQNFFNLEHLKFNKNGDLGNFHIELRFPDGDLSPTSIVAKTYLFFALVLKAVEISKYGLIYPGGKSQWERKKEIMDLLSNNDGNLARSDTSKIRENEIRELQQNASDLLHFLKSIFNKFTNPAYAVLKSLVEKPISLRRIENDNWEMIENDLRATAYYPDFIDKKDYAIIKIIELGLKKNKSSISEWLKDVSEKTGIPANEIKQRIDGYIEKYPVWDKELGAFVFQK
ncbi:MAG: hypothetical protein ABFR75_09660 [Acidobacteriota bacterium]